MTSTAKTHKTYSSGAAILLNAPFFAIVFSHFMTDLYVGQRSIYLTYLSKPLGLSNTELGAITTGAVMAAGLSQPIFGWLADRIGPRRMILAAIAWIALTYALSIVLPITAAAPLLILANLGAGMYHPAGVSQATLIGRTQLAGRESTAASYFFLFGQLGFFAGPLLGGVLLSKWGDYGLLVLIALAIPALVFAQRALKILPKVERTIPADQPREAPRKPKLFWWSASALVAAAAFQSWVQQNVTTFMPKHMSDLGKPSSYYGLLAALFLAGTAVGNLVGGPLADKIGKRPVIAVSLFLAGLPLFLMSRLEIGFLWYAMLFLSGAMMGAAYSSLVVLGQKLAPGGGALASGLVLGFIFSSGALGAVLTGALADSTGSFPAVYLFSAGLAVAGGLVSLLLDRHVKQTPEAIRE